MKRNNSVWNPLIIVGSIFIFGAFLLLSTCLLILGLRSFSSRSFSEVATQIPTSTPTPLPATIKDVETNCSKGECLNACLAHADRQLQASKLTSYEYSGDEVTLVYYGISDEDGLEKPRKFEIPEELMSYQQNETAHKAIWMFYRTLLPRESRPDLVTLGLFISSDMLGYFDTTATENWLTHINILSLEDSYTLSSVLVHEYGHYLTLNRSQRLSVNQIPYCRQKLLYRCPKPDSYINLFYLEFWEDIYPEWKKIDWQSRHYEEEINLFYQKHADRFLNDYAATDPIEDIAESWEAFILKPTPSGDSIPEQKIKFFYNFPELVQLRYQIIKGICTFEITE